MKRFVICLFLSLTLASPSLSFSLPNIFGSARTDSASETTLSEQSKPAANFEVQKLDEGVYGVIRKDPPGLMVDANSVFIINDSDVVVVDTSGAPSTTKEVLNALRKLTDKPVSCVINTHWHDDHIRGNKVYREAFPKAEFIARANMREYMATTGETNRKNFVAGAPPVIQQLKDLVAKNKSLTGAGLSAEERESYLSDIGLAELAIGEAPQAETILPTLTVEDNLTLYRDKRVIEIRHVGSGHTTGDLVVWLPAERILITGDLVVWPVPLVGAEQSRIADWKTTLDKLQTFNAATIVPGHGKLMHDADYLKSMSELFASIKQQADAAVSRGETIEQARKSLDLSDLKRKFAGDSPVRKFLFDVYVTQPAFTAAFREASAKH